MWRTCGPHRGAHTVPACSWQGRCQGHPRAHTPLLQNRCWPQWTKEGCWCAPAPALPWRSSQAPMSCTTPPASTVVASNYRCHTKRLSRHMHPSFCFQRQQRHRRQGTQSCQGFTWHCCSAPWALELPLRHAAGCLHSCMRVELEELCQ